MNDLSKLNYSQSATKSLKPRVSHQGFEKISRNLLYKWTGSNQGRYNSVIPSYSVALWPHCPTPHWIQPEGQFGGRAGLGPGAEETWGGGVRLGSFSGVRRRQEAERLCGSSLQSEGAVGLREVGNGGTRERGGSEGESRVPSRAKRRGGNGRAESPGERGAHSLQKTYSV